LNGTFEGTIVFHPHGVLSATMTAGECAAQRVVLSEEDYHQLYSNPYSWANLVQLSLLMTYSCLAAPMASLGVAVPGWGGLAAISGCFTLPMTACPPSLT
jgi:hypothetical protein